MSITLITFAAQPDEEARGGAREQQQGCKVRASLCERLKDVWLISSADLQPLTFYLFLPPLVFTLLYRRDNGNKTKRV